MESKTYSVESNGASLRVREAQVDGTPMLLVHGGPGGTDYLFKFFAKPVADAGYKAVGFIQRGSLGSPSDGPFTIQAFADDIEAIRARLGSEKIALLGHSWGGFLSTIYAAQHPKRVERLMLVCPVGARTGWREEFDAEIVRRLSAEDKREFDRLTGEIEKAASREERGKLMFQRANLSVSSYYSAKHRAGKPGLAFLDPIVRETVVNQFESWYEAAEWERGLARLKCPVAIIYGEEDVVPRRVVEDYRAMLPGARVVGLRDCGHFPWMEEAEAFWREMKAGVRQG